MKGVSFLLFCLILCRLQAHSQGCIAIRNISGFSQDNGINGANPFGSLMQASGGKLYGMSCDVIFSFDPSSSTYTKLQDFDGNNGANPYGSLEPVRPGWNKSNSFSFCTDL